MSLEVTELAPGLVRLPLRTPTLPPATHTNVYVVGQEALTVVDPASPWDDPQALLHGWLDAHGGRVERILLTHHHDDHVGGAKALQQHLAAQGHTVPVVAHRATAKLLAGRVKVDAFVEEGDVVQADAVRLDVMHTPGHAPGHVVLHDAASGRVIAGDMVAGVGTIVLLPSDGTLTEYLASLERMKRLGASALLPSHGPVLEHAEATLAFYLGHRHQRSDQIRRALTTRGWTTAFELVPVIYPELPEPAVPIGALQITTHLLWWVEQGEVVGDDEGRFRLRR